MSSKSKKKSVPQAAKQHRHAPALDTKSTTDGAPEEHDLAEKVEEVLYVPSGRSPLRFLMVVLAVILLTAIFAIDPSVMFRATQRGGDTYMTWNHPSKGKIEISGAEFQNAMRRLNDFVRLFSGRPTAEDTARFLVLDELAQDAGVRITDAELTEHLGELAAQFGDAAALKQYMRQTDGGIQGFQETMRRQLNGQRYVRLLAYMAATPDPERIQKVWLAAHQERAFDYVELERDLLLEDARAELPDDALLEQWLAERDEVGKSAFEEAERMRAELVGFLFDGENDAAGLLERYPDAAPEDDAHGDDAHEHEPEDAEGADEPDPAQALAKKYYDRVLYWRFTRPLAEGETPSSDFSTRYFALEEVEAIAEREAPIYFALERWLADLRKRTLDGEELDLEADARALGLSYRPAVDALSAAEWNEVGGFGGASLGERLPRLAVGEISPVLMIEEGGISIGRLAEKTPAFMPEFALVRDAVAAAWIEARAGELAVSRLATLRAGFGPLPSDIEEGDAKEGDEAEVADADPLPHAPEAQFAEAAAAIGLAVMRRPHMEYATAVLRDPDAPLPGHAFIRANAAQFEGLAEGEIAEPALGSEGTSAFLVRAAGSRDPELWKLSPLEYEESLKSAEYQTTVEFLRDNFEFDVLAEKYAITLPKSDG